MKSQSQQQIELNKKITKDMEDLKNTIDHLNLNENYKHYVQELQNIQDFQVHMVYLLK